MATVAFFPHAEVAGLRTDLPNRADDLGQLGIMVQDVRHPDKVFAFRKFFLLGRRNPRWRISALNADDGFSTFAVEYGTVINIGQAGAPELMDEIESRYHPEIVMAAQCNGLSVAEVAEIRDEK